MSTETVCRRINGAIDTDFYRTRALRERSAATAALLRRAGGALRRVTLAFLASLKLAAGRPMPDPGAVMLIAQAAVRHPKI